VPLPAPAVWLILFAAVFLTRLITLNRAVLDWDESLYYLMAQQWRLGHLPYTTIWDNKPLGIYAIFVAFQAAIGHGVLAIRLATVFFVSALAWSVFAITETITNQRPAAWAAGGALVLGALGNDGLSANTELFMASFTAIGVLAALRTERGFAVGVLIGCAFMIKYVAVFEAPVIFVWLLWRTRRWQVGAACIIGAALPLLLVMALYAANGRFGLWADCSVLSNFRRVAAAPAANATSYALHTQLWRWGTFYAAGLAMVGNALWRRGWAVFLSAWLLGGLLGAAAARSFYDHYFLQVLPALCVITGVWFGRLPGAWRAVFLLAVLSLPAWAAQEALRETMRPDETARIGAVLRAARPPSLYVFDGQPILYALAGVPPPTRYVLPSELTRNLLPRVAGVDPVAEEARILAQSPAYIVREANPPTDPAVVNRAVYAELDAALAADYVLWRREGDVLIYRGK